MRGVSQPDIATLPQPRTAVPKPVMVPVHPVPSIPLFLSKGQMASTSSSIFERLISRNTQLGLQVDNTVS